MWISGDNSAGARADLGARSGGAASFEELRRRTNVQGLRAALTVALVVVTAFALVEYNFVSTRFLFLQFLRGACLLVLATVLVVSFRRYEWTKRNVDALTICAFLSCGWYSIALMSLHDGYESTFFLTLAFIIVGVLAVTMWPLATSLLYLALVIASYLAPLLLGFTTVKEPDVFWIRLSFLLGMALISIVAQQLRYQIERREFRTGTQLKETKTSLEAAYDKLKELDQLKTDFFANVSHELRTPLTLSLGSLESLFKRSRSPDDLENLQALRRNQLRLLRLINQLLDFAKVEAGGEVVNYRTVDLAALVHDVVGEVEPAFDSKGIALTLALPDDPIEARCDPHKIQQVLLNLLSNAFKFTSRGGCVEVEAACLDEVATLKVSDTGVGIPLDRQRVVFDRFSQADVSETREYAGTGIGLALVQSYARLHGGGVSLESTPGKGSTFIVTLPRAIDRSSADDVRSPEGEAPPSHLKPDQLIDFRHEGNLVHENEPLPTDPRLREAPSPARADSRLPGSLGVEGRPRVLIVDDDRDMRRYLRSLLSHDYEVRAETDGAAGLDTARRWDPDVVVSDLMMPVMSGAEMCREIKGAGGRLARTPVILVTARSEEQARLRSLDYGADDYLLKPFLQDELLLRVRNLAIKRQQERALLDAHLTLRAQHRQVQSDIELAREFQHSLLSELHMPPPVSAHVEFRPADLVGGDFYHAAQLGRSRVRLLLGDMVDHGVKAAVRAAVAWSEYTGFDHARLQPHEVLEHLNSVATRKYEDLSGSFLCMDLEVLDHGEVVVHYSQAGKMPLAMLRGPVATIPPAAQGFVVGLFPDMTYESQRVVLPAGARLFAYSDGLYTQPNEHGEAFETAGLNAAWRITAEYADLVDATRALLAKLDEFRATTPQVDDLTLIGFEIGGGESNAEE